MRTLIMILLISSLSLASNRRRTSILMHTFSLLTTAGPATPIKNKQAYEKYLSQIDQKHVLVVGDGDMSFSRALSDTRICKSLTASTLDSPDELLACFEKAQDNVKAITGNKDNVIYGVDATNISSTTVYDVIIWNFPHKTGISLYFFVRSVL